jgi:hypothetical protein
VPAFRIVTILKRYTNQSHQCRSVADLPFLIRDHPRLSAVGFCRISVISVDQWLDCFFLEGFGYGPEAERLRPDLMFRFDV